MLLQAYDFAYLAEKYDCTVQCGGADQWGNIVAGMEYGRRTLGRSLYGFTFPLLTTASGSKVGKSEKGALWLDPNKTPPYDFFQYWVRTDDRDVERFLKMFTLLELEEIVGIVRQHTEAPEKRFGQKRLAWEVTRAVHGEDEANKARDAAEALYGTALKDLSDERLRELFPDVPSVSVSAADLDAGWPLAAACVAAGLASSKKEAVRLLDQGGLYVNNECLAADKKTLTREDLASTSMMLLRAGKKRYCLVKVEG